MTPLRVLTGVKEVTLTAPGYVTSAAGDKAGAVKFTATVNEQGYLSEFDATLPGIDNGQDGEYDAKLSDFGAPVTITKPTGAKVVEAPAALYAA